MLDIALQILSVLGIILLALLGLLLAVVLLVLFFPVNYRISGKKDGKDLNVDARASWLFGLLRIQYAYPEPGKLTAKVLWLTVYDSAKAAQDGKDDTEAAESPNGQKDVLPEASESYISNTKEGREQAEAKKENSPENPDEASQKEQNKAVGEGQESAAQGDQKETSEEDQKQASSEKNSWISEKIEKIKYTIRARYDKIKRIWQNISYHMELLREEDTKLLFHHTLSRIWRILKSIRPRKLKAEVLFGTGAPDTTGYAYGVYGMLFPLLGTDVTVTPDFQRAVLEGSFYAAGHITAAVLLWHMLRILLNRRLWQFWRRLKNKGKMQANHKVSKA